MINMHYLFLKNCTLSLSLLELASNCKFTQTRKQELTIIGLHI